MRDFGVGVLKLSLQAVAIAFAFVAFASLQAAAYGLFISPVQATALHHASVIGFFGLLIPFSSYASILLVRQLREAALRRLG